MTPPAAPSHRSFVWFVLIAATVAAAGLWFGSRQFGAGARPELLNAALYPQPRAVPDFRLTQANGSPLTPADWRGHWNVVYFGYTNCPDVCPTALATFRQAWKTLDELGLQDRVRFDFISVDPQRDTPEKLGAYVAFFNPGFVAATGSDEQLTMLTRSLGLIYSRTTSADGAVVVDHSGSAVIVDPQARVVGIFRPPFSAPALVRDLTVLTSAAGG